MVEKPISTCVFIMILAALFAAPCAAEPNFLVSSEEERSLMTAPARESYNKLLLTINARLEMDMVFETEYSGKISLGVPFTVAINNETGEYRILSSPFPDGELGEKTYLTDNLDLNGYTVKTATVQRERNWTTLGLDKDQLKDTGSLAYSSMLDLPLTKYVLGNLTYRTQPFFGSADGMVSEKQRNLIKGMSERMGGDDGLDRALSEGQAVFSDLLMRDVPMMLMTLSLVVQLALLMWGWATGTTNTSSGAVGVVIRWTCFMLIVFFYKPLVAFIIDFFAYMTDFIVPARTQAHIAASLLASAGMADSSASTTVIGWAMTLFRYLGYIAIQILMIMRDVFLALTVLFGPIVIAVSFPAPVDKNSAAGFLRGMLSGWIEGFTRLMLWAPVGAACIVLLGATTVVSGLGLQSTLVSVVMSVSMMFACTKVPDLAEKMSGQGLAAVFSVIGGSVLSTAGTAATETVKLGGSALSSAGGLAAGAAVRRIGDMAGREAQDLVNGSANAREGADSVPRVDIAHPGGGRGPAT